MCDVRQLLKIYFGKPSYLEGRYELPGYAYLDGERWKLTAHGEDLIQTELSRIGAILFPNEM